MKISLCLIVGNVETYIERCLTSFAPLADEIICVRAIGCAPPDRTLDIARNRFGAKCFEYRNAPGHEDWPHVDNFAAARQMSFDQASGEFCFWCDSDDVLTSGAERVRQLAAENKFDAYVFPYDIHGRGMIVPRERMLRKSKGYWMYPVHECFRFHQEPANGMEDNTVMVTHLPVFNRSDSNPRNLRILNSIPINEMNAGLLYHLMVERAMTHDIAGSVEAARLALKHPELGRPEKYEIFLNLARITTRPSEQAIMLHQAYAADPNRRESLGLLACHAMDHGANDDALSYALQMKATPIPRKIAWNDRLAAYGYVGEDIHQQALRINGQHVEAEKLRLDYLRSVGGPRIALVHATRGRAVQASLCRKIWLDTARHPERVEHIFVMDEDDEESSPLRRMHHMVIPAGGGCVAAWNQGAFATEAPVLVQLSDDWTPPHYWDEEILNRLGDPNIPRVLAVNDGHRTDDLLCMAICTRAYLNLDWFLFHPGFTGVYSDNWFTELARQRHAVIDAKDLVFEHNHPAFGSADMDETYARQNSPDRYAAGLKQLAWLRSGRDWSSIPGFFNFWPFYQVIAQRLQDGDTVAELGVWFGRSLIFLAQELQRRGKKVKLIAVDTFRGEIGEPQHAQVVAQHGGSIRAAFESNLERCGVREMVTVIESDSAAAAKMVENGELSFCFVDAAHDYQSVRADVAAWLPKIKPGGIFAGHDAQWHEVTKAAKEVLGEIKIAGAIWIKAVT